MTIFNRIPVLAPFQVKSFRNQWPADLLTSWAFEMETLILGWFILVQSGSVILLTLFGALQYMGSLFGPLFGVAGDRHGHRRVLALMRAGFAVLAAVLLLLARWDALSPTAVLAIAAINGLIRPSDMGVRTALVAATVPSNDLTPALGLSRTTADSARVVGALTGAGLFATFGIEWAYVVVVLVYLASVALTLRTGEAAPATAAVRRSPWRDLREGLGYVWTTPHLQAAMWIAFLVNFCAFPISGGLLPYVAKTIYGVDERGLGWLVASFAFGALIGSLGLSVAGSAVRSARVMLIGTAVWYALLLVFAQTGRPALGAPLLMLAGFFQSLSLVTLNVILMRTSEPAYRGRVMGVRMLAIYSLPIGLLIGGALVKSIGFPATGTVYALLGLVLTALIWGRWHANLWPREAAANGP